MSEFTDYLHEVFELLGPISARRMFGGYGIYHDGLMFALVFEDTLYLKADAGNVATFEEQGLAPFEYLKQAKPLKLSFYLAPDVVLDDREAAAEWGRRSVEAALRASAAKRKPKRGSKR